MSKDLESKLYIVDNLSLVRTQSEEEMVCNVLCCQVEPDRSFVYGLKYDYGSILPQDVFVKRLDDMYRKSERYPILTEGLFILAGVSYECEPTPKEIVPVVLRGGDDAIHRYWRDHQVTRMQGESVSLPRKLAFAFRRFLDV